MPAYEELLELDEIDGHAGNWVLLYASIHEAATDGRESRGWVQSVFASERSLEQISREIADGRDIGDRGVPELGADYYTFHGEIPWSPAYGSDVRNARGKPRHATDRAFDYFDLGWKRGIPVENSSRRWGWESYHSALNQAGPIIFPAPAFASGIGLRTAQGSSDMFDERGQLATLYREMPGSTTGSSFLYVRRDLVDRYSKTNKMRLLQVGAGERTLSYRFFERSLAEEALKIIQAGDNEFKISPRLV